MFFFASDSFVLRVRAVRRDAVAGRHGQFTSGNNRPSGVPSAGHVPMGTDRSDGRRGGVRRTDELRGQTVLGVVRCTDKFVWIIYPDENGTPSIVRGK